MRRGEQRVCGYYLQKCVGSSIIIRPRLICLAPHAALSGARTVNQEDESVPRQCLSEERVRRYNKMVQSAQLPSRPCMKQLIKLAITVYFT